MFTGLAEGEEGRDVCYKSSEEAFNGSERVTIYLCGVLAGAVDWETNQGNDY